MSDEMYDVAIIGGGPAGFTAGIYTAREELKTVLLEKSMTGGIPAITDIIENYPGFPEGIAGMDLVARFRQQAERFGVEIQEFEEVQRIEKQENQFLIHTEANLFRAKTVIIATGGLPRQLGVPGEKEFIGRGVSYCATCDGPFFKDGEIAVVGGGDAAIQEAIFLTKFASRVTVIHRRDALRASPILQQRAFSNEKIDFLWDSVVTEVVGQENVTSLKVKNVKTAEVKNFVTEGLFVFIGWIPNSQFLDGLIDLDEAGHVLTDRYMMTSLEGLYAVGDVRSKKFRQIAEACGDATVGALSASEYISDKQL